jgi:hypothetical protein
MSEQPRGFQISFFGARPPSSGEFALCSGELCTGPLPWNSTSSTIADALAAIGLRVVEHSGGPLPSPVHVTLETGEVTADEGNSLIAEMEAYLGGGPISVIVAPD